MTTITTLQHQLDQTKAQLAAIREISQAIAEAQDLDDTLDLITRRTTEVMHVQSCSIYLYNQTGDQLVLAASTGLNQDGIGQFSLPHGAGLTGWAAEHRETVAVADAFADARFYRIIGSGESRFPSLMSMPMVSHDKVIGAVNVQTEQRHEFTADEIELFGFIVGLAATALEKAQLVHSAIVQEMHHRVKNNLQTVAMLLRLQTGYSSISPSDILNETINRVLSIATVHEILSETGVDRVGVLELIKRLANTISGNMINPATTINISVEGNNLKVPAQQATNLALVTNELIQNALEHSLADRSEGNIRITLKGEGGQLSLVIQDDGQGLPAKFDPTTDFSLGLDIVQATITEDMNGEFYLEPAPGGGTRAVVNVPLR